MAYHPTMTTMRPTEAGDGPAATADAATAPAEDAPAGTVIPAPADEVARLLDSPDAAAQLAAIDRATLTALTTTTTAAARDLADAAWLGRLAPLRRALLLRGERPLLALVLGVQARLAISLGQPAAGADAADTLWGVRELLGQPWKAHAAMLLLAEAQAASGEPASAEATLLKAVESARKLAPAGNLVKASAAVARTLIQLGELLGSQGRGAEALEWLEGAVDVAPDDGSRAAAEAALARFVG